MNSHKLPPLISTWTRFQKNRGALLGFLLLLCISTMALIGPFLTSYTYEQTHLTLKNLSPSSQFWFGTDDLGRDIFTRTWYGARISLFVGLSAALIDVIIGVFWGGTAAWIGGKVEEIMMRFADLLYSLPYLLIVIVLTVILKAGLVSIILAMTLLGWITMARIVRGQILQLKNQDFILAAIAIGASKKYIFFKHLLPNSLGPIIMTATLTIPSAIFVEAFLSFLGLGVQVPIASWGTMVNEGLPALSFYPWRLFFPALFISLTILAFNLVGEGLRDAFDIRSSLAGEK